MKAAIQNIFGALAMAAVLVLPAAIHELLQDAPGHEQDWADSAELKELQASAEGSARRQRAAQALCNKARGPNSEARWTPDGDLVCTVRNGVRRVQL